MIVLVILFNDPFPANKDEFSKTERGFSLENYYLQKHLSVFTQVLHIGKVEVIFKGKMFRFQNDCSSHQIKIIVYIK